MEKQYQNIELRNFIWLLNFLERSKGGFLGIVGGEPTLHPQFREIVKEMTKRHFLRGFRLYTNGTFNEEVRSILIDASNLKSTNMLINFNHPDVIGSKKYNAIIDNLEVLSQNEKIGIGLGINFYQENQDYQYFLDTAIKYKIKHCRWSLVIPNSKEKKQNMKQYYEQFVPVIGRFIKEAANLGLETGVDCNFVPLCRMDADFLRTLLLTDKANSTYRCQSVIDVQPDMQAMRCYGLSQYTTDIRPFFNLDEIKQYFDDLVMKEFPEHNVFDECKDCLFFKKNENRSCICLTFNQELNK
jgi:MoaA/NifB/PqqE/SkfB family radical SAM enzyme